MSYRSVKDEVNALIAELPLGAEFKTADLYHVCRNYNATMGSVGYAIRINPRIKCITPERKTVHVWKVVE